MSHYAAAVGRQMGLAEQEVDDLLHAAPLHDIGKIGIPDRILLKPGRLDDPEWKIMRHHSQMGAHILADSEAGVLRLGSVIARTHHERWDGSGYPSGLSGEKIPLVGRIVAIADVFDALLSKRPYKPPFSLDEACSLLREGRGRHFDPAVVDAFFEIEEEILEIRERFRDENVSALGFGED